MRDFVSTLSAITPRSNLEVNLYVGSGAQVDRLAGAKLAQHFLLGSILCKSKTRFKVHISTEHVVITEIISQFYWVHVNPIVT
jgi:hypothetical protein